MAFCSTLITGDDSITGSAARVAQKSFTKTLAGRMNVGDVPIRKPATYCNLPAIEFIVEEEKVLSDQFKYALVVKFSRGLPVLKEIHPALVKLGLRGAFNVHALKPGYILINPSLEEDFARLWVRQDWFIAGRSMRLFKWTPAFSYSKESAIAPVWVNLPDLPLHLFAKGALYSITCLIGNPIKIDELTANRTRPSIARVCVEIDLLQPTVSQIIIKSRQNIFEQKVFIEDKPLFCNLCLHRGHDPENFFSNHQNIPHNRTKNPSTTDIKSKESSDLTKNTNTNPQKTVTQKPETQNASKNQASEPNSKNRNKKVPLQLKPLAKNKKRKQKKSQTKLTTAHLQPETYNPNNNLSHTTTNSELHNPATNNENRIQFTKTQPMSSFTPANFEIGECSSQSRPKPSDFKSPSVLELANSGNPKLSAKKVANLSPSRNPLSSNQFSALEDLKDTESSPPKLAVLV